MSTDYSAICKKCKKEIHLGQRFAGGCSFGFGSNDETNRKKAMEFIIDHCEHGVVEVMIADQVPDEYDYIHLEVER